MGFCGYQLYQSIEEKRKNGRKKKKDGTKALKMFYTFLTFFFFFSFVVFFEDFMPRRVYVGRPPGVGVCPSSGRGNRREQKS